MFEIAMVGFIAGVLVYTVKAAGEFVNGLFNVESWIPTKKDVIKKLTSDNVDESSFPENKKRN